MLSKTINDFVEINNFEMIFINNKLKILYYTDIPVFKDNVIKIKYNGKMIVIKGKKLIIETMYKEYVIVSGIIEQIILEDFYE